MAAKNGAGRDARRTARREARLEVKMERTGTKKAPLLSTKARNILLLVLAGILVLLLGAWIFTDSQSFVAKVDGRRVRNDEYQYFLKLQQSEVESKEGLTAKTDEERKAYWAQDAVNGENPILSAKNAALDNAKEYAIQLQKAKDMGLSVDDTIRTNVDTRIAGIKESLGDAFASNLEGMGLTEARYTDILRNYHLIENFRTKYLAENYKAAEISDDAVKAVYDKDPNTYDAVSTRILFLAKTKADDGSALDDATIAEKKKLAESLLARVKAGEDMETLVKENSDNESAKESGGLQDLTYSMQPYMPEVVDWAFAAKVGDADLLDTTYGLFVLRVEKRTGYDDAKQGIRTDLEGKAEDDFYTAALDGWMKDPKYNVVLKERVFEKFTIQ